MTLRARLVLALVGLTAAGLAVAALATHSALRDFLVDRVDEQLQQAEVVMRRELARELGPGRPPPQPRAPLRLPSGSYGELRSGDGAVVAALEVGLGGASGRRASVEDLPVRRSVLTADGYRLLVVPAANGASLVVGIPLDETEATLARLVRIEALVATVVLAALAGLGWWVVKVGLRPLEEMETTAHAIAGGDLARRVERTDPRTEVGRLGSSLNTMLHRIEGAFAERKASEDRLRRFVADVSHELRTPLTSIRGYAELFRRGAADRPEDLAKSMRRIEEEAARLGVLVEDLLLLARLDEGRPLEQEVVDVTAVARDAVDDARAVQPGRPIALEADAPHLVVGDDGRLRQAVGNLVANALAHTPPATPVAVRVREADGTVVLEVADEGPGLGAADRARVFERFYRVDSSRWRGDGGGSGLGLSIVAAVAEAHGGRAEVDSSPGAGARFRLVLPAHG